VNGRAEAPRTAGGRQAAATAFPRVRTGSPCGTQVMRPRRAGPGRPGRIGWNQVRSGTDRHPSRLRADAGRGDTCSPASGGWVPSWSEPRGINRKRRGG